MYIPKPFSPIQLQTEGLQHNVSAACSEMVFGANSLPVSIVAGGKEILAAPIRFVGREDNREIVWDTDYENNESESFVQRRADNEVVICGALRSRSFFIDTAVKITYDGCISVDAKLCNVGYLIAERYGLIPTRERDYIFENLWLEIPIKKEIAKNYIFWPQEKENSEPGAMGSAKMKYAGRVSDKDETFPFKAVMWLGDDDCGLGFFAENYKNWQPEDLEKCIEIIHNDNEVVLRVRLLDSKPECWNTDKTLSEPKEPIVFRFGFQPTPVKPYPKRPQVHNLVHIDLGNTKIKGNYKEYLLTQVNGKNLLDRMQEKGVDTLVLHEKWNKSQNYFELSEFTAQQLALIVNEAHKRGIKVVPYFGYEFSTMSEEWANLGKRITRMDDARQKPEGGWYRVPYQRAFVVCYNNEWQDRFVNGFIKIMDTYHVDGIYLDGSAIPRCCTNTEHGCGWYDLKGNLHGSYQLYAIQSFHRKLYEQITARGGTVEMHTIAMNFMALPYATNTLGGEHLQEVYREGRYEDFDLELFQIEFSGRNVGVPNEFIVYEKRPLWKFEEGISMSIIHGILPRVNDVGEPLDIMSAIWKVFKKFPIEDAKWCPYWLNNVKVSNEKVKASYYKYTTLSGKETMLILCANITANPIRDVEIIFEEPIQTMVDAITGERVQKLNFSKYGYAILYAE